jgi:hypothetical protein
MDAFRDAANRYGSINKHNFERAFARLLRKASGHARACRQRLSARVAGV